MVADAISPRLNTGQDPSFFTTVSSNGTNAGSAVIWAVSRPTGLSVTLYAFNAATGAALYSAPAGIWTRPQANANVVPVVANARVFVASYQQFAIFGPGGTQPPAQPNVARAEPRHETTGHQITGVIKSVLGPLVVLQTRTGARIRVNSTAAQKAHLSYPPIIGNAVTARGAYDATGVLRAQTILRSKDPPALWEPDN